MIEKWGQEQVSKVKTDNDTDTRTAMLIGIACGPSRLKFVSFAKKYHTGGALKYRPEL